MLTSNFCSLDVFQRQKLRNSSYAYHHQTQQAL